MTGSSGSSFRRYLSDCFVEERRSTSLSSLISMSSGGGRRMSISSMLALARASSAICVLSGSSDVWGGWKGVLLVRAICTPGMLAGRSGYRADCCVLLEPAMVSSGHA